MTTPPIGAPQGAGVLGATGVFATRYLLRLRRSPELIVAAVTEPILYLLVFGVALGGAINAPGTSYIQYLLPGVLVATAAFNAVGGTATGLAEELQRGVVDRYRTMPAGVAGLLLGRTVMDATRAGVSMAITLVLGVAMGVRLEAGVPAALGGLALLVLTAWVGSWLGAVIALLVRGAQATQYTVLLLLFPATFASSAWVPTESMPAWLRPLAEVNPVTAVADTVRAAFGGTPVEGMPGRAALWLAAGLALAMPLALTRLSRQGRR